ncbi:hypothetical protein CVD19_13525 [Bacillus sp. T33-2]|nr:hypothetical protein CVD19_13525 [Bacillus sp. T33-2]
MESNTQPENVQPSDDLVRSCLYNWLGYGNLNGHIWFIGIEEGGAEIWRSKTKTLIESLNLRSQFDLSMEFTNVWEELYDIPLTTFKGPNVWRYQAAFLLEYEELNSSPEDINQYIFRSKKFGSKSSNHFICEMMPLPKPSKDSIEEYKFLWNSLKGYYDEVEANRFVLIRNNLLNSEAKIIVSYDQTLTKSMLNYFSDVTSKLIDWQYNHEQYTLYRINLSLSKEVYFLTTHFFGNGRISYDGIKNAAKRIKELVE